MLGRIALKNTVKNWRHSLSALLSLGASFVSLVIFDGYIANVRSIFTDQFRHRQMLGDVILENRNIYSPKGISEPWVYWVTKPQQEAIYKFVEGHKSEVDTVVRTLLFQGMITNGSQSQIFLGRAYDVDAGRQMRGSDWGWNTTYGHPLDQGSDRMETVLGQGLAKKLGCSFHADKKFTTSAGNYEPVDRPFECISKDVQLSTMTPEGQLNAVDLTVPGLIDGGYKDIDDKALHTSLEAAQTLLNTEGVSYLTMSFKPGVSIDDMEKKFDTEVVSQFPDLHMMRWEDHRVGDVFAKTMDFLSIFRNFIIIVILVVSTMSVVNTLVKIVKERTREIGTLRSIGFRSRQVAAMFLYESLYLGMIGTAIGIVMASLLTFFLNSLNIMYKAGMLSEPIAFRVDFVFNSYLIAWALLMTVSLLASYFSTLSILKSKIVDNLIHV